MGQDAVWALHPSRGGRHSPVSDRLDVRWPERRRGSSRIPTTEEEAYEAGWAWNPNTGQVEPYTEEQAYEAGWAWDPGEGKPIPRDEEHAYQVGWGWDPSEGKAVSPDQKW